MPTVDHARRSSRSQADDVDRLKWSPQARRKGSPATYPSHNLTNEANTLHVKLLPLNSNYLLQPALRSHPKTFFYNLQVPLTLSARSG